MSQCDCAGRRDGLDSTDEQDSIAGLLDTPSGCAQVGLKRKLKQRTGRQADKLAVWACILVTTVVSYAFVIVELVKVSRT